jgi:hypothetical protein
MFNWVTRIASFSFASYLSISASANPSTLCQGGSSQLQESATGGSGTYTYSWTSVPAGFTSTMQNPVVTPTVTTQYVALVNDGSQTKTDTLTVTVNPPPSAYAGKDSIYCITPGMHIILYGTAANYSHVLWTTDGDGTFNSDSTLVVLYTPGPHDKLGYIVVTLTLKAFANAPCTHDSAYDMHITLSPCNGINENAEDVFAVYLSPNPSQGLFTMKITGLQNHESTYTVSDVQGKTVLKETLNGTKSVTRNLDLSTYPKGIYIVKVQTGNQVRSEKMVIQ